MADVVRIKARETWHIRDFLLQTSLGKEGTESIAFDYGGEHAVKVEFHGPDEEARARGFLATQVFCTASLETGVSAKVWPLVQEHRDWSDVPPEPLRVFSLQIQRELADFALRTLRVLRWRTRASCPVNPLSCVRFLQWSLDGAAWSPLAPAFEMRAWTEAYAMVPPKVHEEVLDLVSRGESEPVGHELFREAWELRLAHPRSSLAIGIAAIEIATKETIVHLVPDSRWLVEHQPSPNVVSMIRDGFPAILAGLGLNPRFHVSSKNGALESLKKGVTLRNEMVHSRGHGPSADTLLEVLEAIRDFMWLFDVMRGHEWAVGSIRTDVLASWQSSEASKK
jgi:hypothetical protein